MRFYYLFLLLLINQVVSAQTNSVFVKNVDNYYYCTGQELQVNFTTIGDFAASNQFKVQISDKTGSNFIDTGISGKSSPITFKIPDTLSKGDNYKIRVVATNPSVVGVPSNAFQIFVKPSAILEAPDLKYPINRNQDVYFYISLAGGAPYEVTLSDSSKYNLYDSDYPQSIRKNPYETTTYSVAKISNFCGVGKPSNEIIAKVNELSFKILSLNDTYYFCPGGKIRLSYTVNGKLNADNKFKLLITNNATPAYEKTIDIVPDPSSENFLVGTLPDDLKYQANYWIKLQTSSPALVANNGIYIYPKAIGRVSATMEYDTPYITTNVYGGAPPYTIHYSDGTTYSGNNGNTLDIPIQTNSYKVLKMSLTDQCGNIPFDDDEIVVSGPNYMTLDTLPTRIFCKSEQIELGFKSNLTFNEKTKFFVNFYKVYPEMITPYGSRVEAKRQGEKLLITTPDGAIGFYKASVEVQNPDLKTEFAVGEIELSGKPQSIMSLNTEYTPHTLDFRSVLNPIKAVIKIDDEEVTLNKNDFNFEYYSAYYSVPIHSSKASKYTLMSIQNACGTNTNVSTIARTPDKTPPARAIKIGAMNKSDFCYEDEISIPFKIDGSLNSDEEVELYILSNEFGVNDFKIASSRTSPIVTRLRPYSSGKMRIMLKISNTNVTSESRGIKVTYQPEVNISASLPNGSSILKGQRVPLTIRASGILPLSYAINGQTYTIKESMYDPEYSSYRHPLIIFPTESQKFEITNVRNETCGAGRSSQSSVVLNVAPVQIFFDDYNASLPYTVCTNRPLSISYKIYGATNETRYIAQVAERSTKDFKDIKVIKGGNPITLEFPKDLAEGEYLLRLGVVVENQTYYSIARDIRIATLGTATLTASDGGNAISIAEGSATLKINFTGSSQWDYFIPDIQKSSSYSIYDKQTTFSVSPKKKTTYKLWEVENTCGYNDMKGEVTVSVKPQAKVSSINPQKVCTGQSVDLSIQLIGDFVGNEEITFLMTSDGKNFTEIGKIKVPLTINKLAVVIPNGQKEGYYSIYSKIGNQEPIRASDIYLPFSIASAPSLTIAGSSIINTGSSTLINLSAEGTLPIDYELTDGTTGTLSYNKSSIVSVTPSATTTYTLKSVSNTCGIGAVSGQATITVNPPAERSVSTFNNFSSIICTDQSINISFQTQGSFSASNKFQVQLSDAKGENFKNITGAEGLKSPITFKISSDIQGGKNYRFRVIATDPNTAAEASISTYEIGVKATAKLSAIKTTLQNLNESVSVKLDLTGSAPWNVELSDSLRRIFAQTISITETPYTFTYFPKQLYTLKLNTIYNVCGSGSIVGEQYLKIQLITASEATEDWTTGIYPNPASDFLYINHQGINKGLITVNDISGKVILTEAINNGKQNTLLKIGDLTTGVYLISIEGDNKRKVWKLIKE